MIGTCQKKTTNKIYLRKIIKQMNDETWKIQYKKWKDLKPYQIKLIDDGPKSQSQAWLLNSMWCEWIDLNRINGSEISTNDTSAWTDPWDG